MRLFSDLTARGQLVRLRGLARDALAIWRMSDARLRLLNHGENTVYGVRVPGETEDYVLRIHRDEYHPLGDLQSEALWLEHLHRCGIHAPLPVRRDGVAVRRVVTAGMPRGRHVSILRKTHGRLRAMPGWGRARAERVGALLASMHAAAAAFAPPDGFSRRRLDAEGLVGPTASWGDPLAEPLLTGRDREVFLWARERIRADLAALPADREHWGYAHCDLHWGNVLFADGVAKAIDFDDLASSWYLNDLTVNYVPLRWQDPALAEALLAGYRAVRPLPSLAGLGAMHCARRLTSVAWARSRADVPRLLAGLPGRIAFATRTLEAWRSGEDPLEVRWR